MVEPAAFYVPLDGANRFRATAHTSGPWDPAAQHAGPPSALLVRALERCGAREPGAGVPMQLARLTVEILGSVPVAGEIEVEARVARPGRSVELVEGVLRVDGRDTLLARAWRMRTHDAGGTAVGSRDRRPLPVPGPGAEMAPFADSGYLSAMEWRRESGDFRVAGPAAAWARMRIPLVLGEEPSPWQRVAVLADSGNGLSWELDLATWLFINTELTVHLHREPVGEWLCLDAATTVTPGGVGLATSTLSDVEGPIGRGAQALLVAPRPARG